MVHAISQDMDLRSDLMRPAAFVERAVERLELVETHISWVFLLERDVFKVKRPVDFGFLDFRTMESRKLACEAEIALNRRLAPDVYLGVVPVRTGADGRACIGGDGAIVDWAVHMRRLPDEARADNRLARGELSAHDIDAIAARLAEFHASARSDEHTSRFGKREMIRANVDENFAQTRASITDYVSYEEAHEIARWQSAFLEDNAALFEARIRAGRIRDGHGDLRLEHVYLVEGGPVVIDCIEFNERFRFADVCADVAFLSMDLAASRRVDLGERLLAAYARKSNDFDSYAVVDFYESYRAFIRAKVSAMIASDESIAPAARERARADARKYFLLSLSADRASFLEPMLVAVGGIIASGKSTIADRIAAAASAPVIDADRTRKSMVGVGAEEPIHHGAWSGAYDPSFTEHVYDEVFRRAEVVLASGRPVVLDASFRSARLRAKARALAEKYDVPFHFVECSADPAICRARLADREKRASVSDGRLAIFDDFCARYEPVSEIEPSELLVIDTSQPLDTTLQILTRHLETWPRGFVA